MGLTDVSVVPAPPFRANYPLPGRDGLPGVRRPSSPSPTSALRIKQLESNVTELTATLEELKKQLHSQQRSTTPLRKRQYTPTRARREPRGKTGDSTTSSCLVPYPYTASEISLINERLTRAIRGIRLMTRPEITRLCDFIFPPSDALPFIKVLVFLLNIGAHRAWTKSDLISDKRELWAGPWRELKGLLDSKFFMDRLATIMPVEVSTEAALVMEHHLLGNSEVPPKLGRVSSAATALAEWVLAFYARCKLEHGVQDSALMKGPAAGPPACASRPVSRERGRPQATSPAKTRKASLDRRPPSPKVPPSPRAFTRTHSVDSKVPPSPRAFSRTHSVDRTDSKPPLRMPSPRKDPGKPPVKKLSTTRRKPAAKGPPAPTPISPPAAYPAAPFAVPAPLPETLATLPVQDATSPPIRPQRLPSSPPPLSPPPRTAGIPQADHQPVVSPRGPHPATAISPPTTRAWSQVSSEAVPAPRDSLLDSWVVRQGIHIPGRTSPVVHSREVAAAANQAALAAAASAAQPSPSPRAARFRCTPPTSPAPLSPQAIPSPAMAHSLCPPPPPPPPPPLPPPPSVPIHHTQDPKDRDIEGWLDGLGLSQYTDVFRANEIDTDTMGLLVEKDLEDMNIPIGPKKKILHALARRR